MTFALPGQCGTYVLRSPARDPFIHQELLRFVREFLHLTKTREAVRLPRPRNFLRLLFFQLRVRVPVRVRIEVPNPDEVLRPEMYVDAEMETGTPDPVVAVSDSAVLDSGTRQAVLVDKGGGRFEPREVKLGRRGGGYVEVTEGLSEGEAVVTSATFLIDAESNLKAALKEFAEANPTPPEPASGTGTRP